MYQHLAVYASEHAYDIIVGGALVVTAIALEWSIMGRHYRAWFRRR